MTTKKLHLCDGNNLLRRKFESEGPAWAIHAYIQACVDNPPNGVLIWVWDGEGAKKPRQDIHPDYKAKSDSTDEFYLFMDKFRELLTHSNCLQIRCEGREADDVIAELVRTKDPETQIFIDSNDQDYRQLLSDTVMMDYISETLKDLKPDDMRLYKTLVGDKSDSIAGLSRFGHGTYLKLNDAQKCLLEEFIELETDLTVEQAQTKLGFSKAMAERLIQSRDELNKFWRIIGFFHVPQGELNAGAIKGVRNTAAANEIFRELAIPIG
tara:strand:- start:1826 stop:2626 length:801 start_codon:yes stop_codon:yes gene_type:complete